jgi:hypothetical protein
MPEVGDHVIFVDEYAQAHHALLVEVHGGVGYPNPPVNLVYVPDNKDELDPNGRQIKRQSSVVHKTHQAAHGMFWEEAPEDRPGRPITESEILGSKACGGG